MPSSIPSWLIDEPITNDGLPDARHTVRIRCCSAIEVLAAKFQQSSLITLLLCWNNDGYMVVVYSHSIIVFRLEVQIAVAHGSYAVSRDINLALNKKLPADSIVMDLGARDERCTVDMNF